MKIVPVWPRETTLKLVQYKVQQYGRLKTLNMEMEKLCVLSQLFDYATVT